MTIKKREEELQTLMDDLTDQFVRLLSINMEPSHVICDPDQYANLNDYFYLQQNGFPPLPGSHCINSKRIAIMGVTLPVIQRFEDQFKGIYIYGKLIKK